MKFQINVGGKHSAAVTLDYTNETSFTGAIDSEDFGQGSISGTRTDGALSGKASLDGFEADFSATVSDASISGTLSYGWFFKESFTGTRVDAPAQEEAASEDPKTEG